jgi:uncharacterized membrane protein YjgN (DUF898 family)
MKRHYVPPKQGMLGQIVDTAMVLVLVYVSLMLPLLFKAAAKVENAAVRAVDAAQATWESLGQNAIQQEQWIKLGYGPEKAAILINNRFDYTIDPVMLVVTFAVIIGYFIFLLKVSDQQYREVIAEKFDHE